MSLADELARLAQLHESGALSDSEFAQAKARLLDGSHSDAPVNAINNFRRSVDDRWIGGVCGGLGVATGMESWIWRLLLALLCFAGGSGVLIYLLLWIFVPPETQTNLSR
jgi:phage shock protein PspC (stress-responsive transcriptional regulator)